MRWSSLLLLAACNGDGTATPTDHTDIAGPVDLDEDGSFSDVDCDDNDFEVYPGADEYCDEKDNDCDGEIDEDAVNATLYYSDNDRDGYGADGAGTPSCQQPPDTTEAAGDCNDADATINPNAVEVCDDDDVDENCNGTADDDDSTVDPDSRRSFFVDNDEDGFGNDDALVFACDPGPGRSERGGDCDDDDPDANPDLGCNYDWDGTWLATVAFDVDIPDLLVSGTCKFELELVVSEESSRQVYSTRPAMCLLKGFESRSEVSLEASFTSETTIDGEYTFATATLPFSAEFSDGPPTLTGSGESTGVFGKYKGTVGHELTATRRK